MDADQRHGCVQGFPIDVGGRSILALFERQCSTPAVGAPQAQKWVMPTQAPTSLSLSISFCIFCRLMSSISRAARATSKASELSQNTEEYRRWPKTIWRAFEARSTKDVW